MSDTLRVIPPQTPEGYSASPEASVEAPQTHVERERAAVERVLLGPLPLPVERPHDGAVLDVQPTAPEGIGVALTAYQIGGLFEQWRHGE